jgi:hypothetical protein
MYKCKDCDNIEDFIGTWTEMRQGVITQHADGLFETNVGEYVLDSTDDTTPILCFLCGSTNISEV